MKILDSSGQTWRVGRRWLPWRPHPSPGPEKVSSDGLVYPAYLAEAVLVVLLVPAFVVLRAMRLMGWPIEMWRDDELTDVQSVRGWAASRMRMLEIADDLRRGVPPTSARRPDDVGDTA